MYSCAIYIIGCIMSDESFINIHYRLMQELAYLSKNQVKNEQVQKTLKTKCQISRNI